MDRYLQFLVSGITVGCIYALVALGITLVFRTTGALNFAQGAVVMGAGFLLITWRADAWPLVLVMILVLLAGLVTGGAIERLTIRPARAPTHVSLVIITIGVAEILQGLSLIKFGDRPLYTDEYIGSSPIHVLGATVSYQAILIVVGVISSVAVTLLFLERSRIGKGLKASALDSEMASLCGVSPRRVTLISFALSGLLAAIAGILLTPMTGMGFESGLSLGIKGLFAAVLGGLDSLNGALLGGLALGLLESLSLLVFPEYSAAFTFAAVIVVLIVRPQGLTGNKRTKVGAL